MALVGFVSQFMQREVVTLQRSDRLDLADDIMSLGRIRHLPVLEDERLVGIVSQRDLLAASLSTSFDFEPSNRRAFIRSIDVEEVMTEEVETTTPGTRADEAGRRMLELQVGCLPVLDEEGTLVGLLSETDLLRAALGMSPVEGAVDVSPISWPVDMTEEFETLARVRDELRVQLHLGKAEAKELWEDLEHRFADAEARAKGLARKAEEPIHDVTEAARRLLDELRRGYDRLRELL